MSKCWRGIPRDLALSLRDKYSLDTFIETGTLIGYSSSWAARHFGQVYTIEHFDEYYKRARNNLSKYGNVTCIKDLSIYALEGLRAKLNGYYSPLFWLDAHWSEEAHYGRPAKETLVLEEIEQINLWESTHAIIVDDVHKFFTPRWPTMASIWSALENKMQRKVTHVYDVLVAEPIAHKEVLRYALESVNAPAFA